MLHVVLAQAAEETEPSKVAFYIAGGVFVVWAMTLFLVGMRNDSFPGGQTAARGVMAVSLVLMAAAMATAVITA
jgi:hypothetical protein